MTWALRWALVGFCIATVVQFLFSPHPIIVLCAFMVGWVFGVLSVLMDEVMTTLFYWMGKK